MLILLQRSFAGGNYALLDTDTLDPNPDYWVAVLFQKLMGEKVLKVAVEPSDPDLHVFAHCGGKTTSADEGSGSVTLTFVNRSPSKTFSIALAAGVGVNVAAAAVGGAAQRSEWHLTATNRSDKWDHAVRTQATPQLD